MKNRTKSVITACIKSNWVALLLFVVFTVTDLTVFLLYNIVLEPFLYGEILNLVLLAIFMTVYFIREKRNANIREREINSIISDWNSITSDGSLSSDDYREMIERLGRQIDLLEQKYENDKKETSDYYTSWVHQIKTPIAVMKLTLNQNDEKDMALSAELFRIEQYVDMVLTFIMFGSDTNDLVVKEYPLDEIIRETFRKYAQQFILKNIRLDYIPTDSVIVTDKRLFSVIVEQLISNAVKYTQSGTVTVKCENGRLLISDTGIGISSEDLPMIFKKGYTGLNGRTGQKSSGLGLYLCKMAADKLSIGLSAESQVGVGSTFGVSLKLK